jgi:hypothetical protein
MKSFEKGLLAACRFSKEICANLINLPTNSMKGILLGSFEKLLVNWKGFGVKRVGIY